MKYYDSSLYTVFSHLYKLFKNCNGKINEPLKHKSINYYNMLNTFYYNNMPQHIKCLLEHIKNNTLFDDFHKNLNDLYTLSGNCNGCISCDNCAKRFYTMIALLFCNKLSENNYSSWNKRKYSLWSNESEQLLFDETFAFRPIPNNIERHLTKRESINTRYSNLHNHRSANTYYNGHLLMLKGMSSSSPYLYNSVLASHIFTGGGIYIRWNNKGIVIDPGYGFIENMYKHNLFIQDIDIVIITHFHIDHTGDIRLIDDLNRTINKNPPDFECVDDEIAYKPYFNCQHMIHWYVDTDTKNLYMNGLSSLINHITIVEPNQTLKLEENISITTIPTQHVTTSKLKRDNHHNLILDSNNIPELQNQLSQKTFGVQLKLSDSLHKNILIGYSSDTKYTDTLLPFFTNTDYIIANISGIYKDDFLMLNPKKAHLGYLGCLKLLKEIKPKLMIISEFWNGTSDSRIDICRELEKEIKTTLSSTSPKVFPGEIGLDINLIEHTARCSICGNHCSIDKCHYSVSQSEFGAIITVCDKCCN